MSYLLRMITSVAIILLTATTPVWAATTSIVVTDEVQLGLGDAFMADTEYYRAITEYMKFLYLFPDSEHKPYALLQIGMANYSGGEYEQAIESFARVRATYSDEHFATAAFYEGLCYEKLKQPDKARDAFDRALLYKSNLSAESKPVLIGKAFNRISEGDVRGGRKFLEQVLSLDPETAAENESAEALTLLDEFESQPQKSPVLAGSMSAILPGSGYIYAGRYKDGFMSLLVNGLFIAGTAVAIDDENYAVAAIVGGIGVPFYLGNIYGSANAANKWNVSLRKDLLNNLAITLDYRY